MADKAAIVHIGENSPEEVAYKMTWDVLRMEKVTLTRKLYLDTYAECLQAIKDSFGRQQEAKKQSA